MSLSKNINPSFNAGKTEKVLAWKACWPGEAIEADGAVICVCCIRLRSCVVGRGLFGFSPSRN